MVVGGFQGVRRKVKLLLGAVRALCRNTPHVSSGLIHVCTIDLGELCFNWCKRVLYVLYATFVLGCMVSVCVVAACLAMLAFVAIVAPWSSE